ncbi:energy transducer TonB [Agrobacterium rosae]|uniref:energy transducer TonB family protein n=1 Tax=Agrobacterium rosae TaxID=1972867 RepID=UPI002A10E0BE|nr:energy transducer TonB [Agrobacterium rosae]MDX8316176.1 energy transducer TonB [Agrobacterium rosae]
MKTLRFFTILSIAAVLGGCSYTNYVDVEIRTNANGRIMSAKLVEPSNDENFNRKAVEAAKHRFPTRMPDAKPNHIYNQPVNIIYPLIPSKKMPN